MSQRAKIIWLLPLIVAMAFMTSGAASAAVNKPATKPIGLYVQDKLVKPTVAPIVKNGRVYVEFRSVVKALGFTFNYDAAKQVITANSEDASFKIELKTGQTYVNGKRFVYDQGVPMIIASGANTLVIGHLFHATEYLYTDYYADKKIVMVYEDPWGKPKKSDVRTIQSVIKKYYADAGASSVTSIQLKSWGSFVTITADAAFAKGGDVLLNRIEHASIEMERGTVKSGPFTISNPRSNT
ncbi:stalk domain-containing protein [Cohnella suwonensis]|uniref:Stalk domain-containing protein n=1 Tax=Cohnella suwonensis TaxID=696072 RepID=A0ABW0M265_9BACL